MRMRHLMMFALLGLLLPAHAHATDGLLAGGKLCTQHFGATETRNHIPLHLLTAISSAESGRWHKGIGMHVPWPWTINVEGKGYFFDSKKEALAKTKEFIRQGKKSIDIGCMQVNLKHHPRAFSSLEEAFDPAHNIAYAAKFLREHYARTRDWVQATAAYHSRTPKYGKRYLARVQKRWNQIMGKVQTAATGVVSRSGHKVVKLDNPLGAGRYSNPIASTRGVKVIEVSGAPKNNSVLVVKPATAQKLAANVANAAQQEQDALLVKGNAYKAITNRSVDKRVNAAHRIRPTQFVFSN